MRSSALRRGESSLATTRSPVAGRLETRAPSHSFRPARATQLQCRTPLLDAWSALPNLHRSPARQAVSVRRQCLLEMPKPKLPDPPQNRLLFAVDNSLLVSWPPVAPQLSSGRQVPLQGKSPTDRPAREFTRIHNPTPVAPLIGHNHALGFAQRVRSTSQSSPLRGSRCDKELQSRQLQIARSRRLCFLVPLLQRLKPGKRPRIETPSRHHQRPCAVPIVVARITMLPPPRPLLRPQEIAAPFPLVARRRTQRSTEPAHRHATVYCSPAISLESALNFRNLL